jgi:hypothetical protein
MNVKQTISATDQEIAEILMDKADTQDEIVLIEAVIQTERGLETGTLISVKVNTVGELA